MLIESGNNQVSLVGEAGAGPGAGGDSEPGIPQTIEDLEAAIEMERETLIRMASEPIDPMVNQEERADELGEIADRLARLQSALTDLQMQKEDHIHREPIGYRR